MNERATLAAATAFWLLGLGHAAATWPRAATVTVFAGGTAATLAVERIAVDAGLQRIHADRRVFGVPAWVPLVRPASVYAAYRAGTVAFGDGPGAVALAVGLVAFAALRADPDGLDAGLWSYPPSGWSALRYRGVPWWSFAVQVAVAAGVTLAVQPWL